MGKLKKVEDFNKLSDLLEASMADAAVLAKRPDFKFDMDNWVHGSELDKTCSVCQAGATMYRRLMTPEQRRQAKNDGVTFYPGTSVRADTFEEERRIAYRFHALNSLREGEVEIARESFFNKKNLIVAGMEKVFPDGLTPYKTYGHSYTKRYVKAMHRVIRDLRKIGL